MKHTKQTVYREDSELIFESVKTACKVNAQAYHAFNTGVLQYELDNKYYTVEILTDKIIFHCLEQEYLIDKIANPELAS